MSFMDDDFVYEKRLKSEFDRWISEYDMIEARMLSKKAEEDAKKDTQNLLKELKKDIHKAEDMLKHLKESSKDVLHNIEDEIEHIIKSVEEKLKTLKEHIKHD
jgi:vacuolar-type H+-ATPase subunit H